MYRTLFRLVLSFFLLGSLLGPAIAQTQPGRPSAGGPGDKVELLPPGADSLVVLNTPGQVIRKLYNNVRFRHKGVLMYCNLAIQNVTTNVIEAYGNVRIIQGDTISVRGDTMFYYGNVRQANLRGHVVMKDRKMTLTTARLDYDMQGGIAHYPTPGRIVDNENVLTSREGYYDTRSKQFTFKDDVKLVNPKYTLTADSLLYNSLSKIATFQGPTRIVSKDGVLTAVEGQYNTVSRISNFQRRATVETPKYRLTGDSLYYDNITELGVARGHVIMVAKDKQAIILGDHVRYNGKIGISRVTGHAVAKSISGQDTLFLRADTLFSFDNKETNTRRLLAHKNVYVFKSDLQSKCDSLIYNTADSTIYFYKKPIVWSQNKYQMEADSMRAFLKNNRIHTMYLRAKAFVISLDTLQNFNQIKGRTITAYFATKPVATTAVGPKGELTASARPVPPGSTTTAPEQKTELERVIVEGNGQSIYFAVDDKNKLIGMNHVECSRMNLEFTDSKVGTIRFYGQPDSKFVPPHEIVGDVKELDGFRWRQEEKPTKGQVLWLETPPPAQPVNKNSPKKKPGVKPLAKKTVLTSEK
ncbi:hypothetical protein DYU11_19745 [Fibrisoma montanum]|uniref:Organic solvent tolerance-like N-terminal domain-containing protein n=1 Tax=Fibrisoma montanum TaxID=2305895 RepID=A0A418M722_9BACT|nr:OstA-like protein [Fibrisoma montanum]RIV21631.1 hypothetical protein DYU11_19745 [Fibrisoma montanum]